LSRLSATTAITTTATPARIRPMLERFFGAGTEEPTPLRGASPTELLADAECPGASAATIPRAAAPSPVAGLLLA